MLIDHTSKVLYNKNDFNSINILYGRMAMINRIMAKPQNTDKEILPIMLKILIGHLQE